MRLNKTFLSAVLGALLLPLLALLACENPREPAKKVALPDRDDFREQADAKKEIQAAIGRASREGRRVLLFFGGDWCRWCHALHALFDLDPRIGGLLASDYVLLTVDSDANPSLGTTYGNAYQHGFPVLVVLDDKGKLLHVQETRSFEDKERVAHDPAKVLAFLKKWAPPRS